MNLDWSAEDQAFRAEVRAWLAAHVRPLPSGDTEAGFAAGRVWERELFDAGWAVVSWPAAFGGRGASLAQWLIFEEEYWAAGGPPRVTQNGIFLVAPALFQFGTPAQQARYLRPMARADEVWAQAWSEPGSGSDLASLRTSARRVDGGWRITGQKTWCTRAGWCDRLYALVRTDPAAKKPHQGLTAMMVDVHQPGVSVRPFGRLDGDPGFAEVFFDDALCADGDVLGLVHGGWGVAMATTGSERGLTLRSPGRFLATAERLRVLVQQRASGDPVAARALGRLWTRMESYRLQTLEVIASASHDGSSSSLAKLWWSTWDVEAHQFAMDLLGPEAERDDGEAGVWTRGWQFALGGPIYAGTNEIQRNIVAERLLGLPRG